MVAPGAGPAKGRAKGAEQGEGGHHRRAEVLFLLKIVSSLLFFPILQMVSHVFILVPAPSETCWFRGMSVGGSFRRV